MNVESLAHRLCRGSRGPARLRGNLWTRLRPFAGEGAIDTVRGANQARPILWLLRCQGGGLLAAALLGAGCGGSSVPSIPHVDLRHADVRTAGFVTELRAAAERHPNDGEQRGALAMAYDVNGFSEAALAVYAQAAALAPKDPRWPYHRAMLLAHRGELEVAMDWLERAQDLDPNHAPASMWRGAWLLDLGRLAEAEAAFATAERLGIGAPALVGRARVALRRGDAEAAAALLHSLGPALRHSDVASLLAAAARRLGRADEARVALAAVEAGPLRWRDARSEEKRGFEASLAARLAGARRLLAEGDAEGALAAAKALRKKHPQRQGLLAVLAEALRRLQRHDEALAVLREAIAAHPRHFPFHLNMAELLIARGNGRGDGDEALTHLNRALALNPRLPWAHAQRGLLLLEHDVESALAAFETAAAQDPRSPQPRYYAGMAEASRRRWRHAIEHFAAAVDAAPTYTLGHIGLARALAEAGRFDAAHSALSEAQRLGTHPQETAAARAWLRRRERTP